MTKPKPSYFGHIVRRQVSSQKAILLGEIEGSWERGRPSLRWTGSITEATGRSPLELGRAIWDRTGRCGYHSFIGSPGFGTNSKHITTYVDLEVMSGCVEGVWW